MAVQFESRWPDQIRNWVWRRSRLSGRMVEAKVAEQQVLNIRTSTNHHQSDSLIVAPIRDQRYDMQLHKMTLAIACIAPTCLEIITAHRGRPYRLSSSQSQCNSSPIPSVACMMGVCLIFLALSYLLAGGSLEGSSVKDRSLSSYAFPTAPSIIFPCQNSHCSVQTA